LRPDCRKRVGQVLGRPMMAEEERAIDRRMRRAVKALKRTEPGWADMTKAQRLDKAAQMAGDSFAAEMEEFRMEVPAKAPPLPEDVRQAERDRQQRMVDQGFTIQAVRGVRFVRGIGNPQDTELTGGRWFTDRPETANTYTGDASGDMSTASMKVRLRLRNPLVIDAQGKRFDGIPREWLPEDVQKQAIRGKLLSTDDIADAARLAEGDYDGIIFKNLKDDLTSNAITTKPATVYAVFDRKNIRSEFAQFDPEMSEYPGLLFQTQRTERLLPLYSAAERAAAKLPPRKMTVAEAIGRIEKGRGLDPAEAGRIKQEVKEMGLREILQGQRMIYPQDLAALIARQRAIFEQVEIETNPKAIDRISKRKMLDEMDIRQRADALRYADISLIHNTHDGVKVVQAHVDPSRLGGWFYQAIKRGDATTFERYRWDEEDGYRVEKLGPIEGAGSMPLDYVFLARLYEENPDYFARKVLREDVVAEYSDAIVAQGGGARMSPGDYDLDDSHRHGEVRITVQMRETMDFLESAAEWREEMVGKIEDDLKAGRVSPDREENARLDRDALLSAAKDFRARLKTGGNYERPGTDSHSGEEGEIINILWSDRKDDANRRTLFIRQLQSDEAQSRAATKKAVTKQAKDKGEGSVSFDILEHYDFVPLVNETSMWVTTAIRSIATKAAEQGYSSISIPTAETSTEIQGNSTAAQHYETNVKGALEKLGQQFGLKVRKGTVQSDNGEYGAYILDLTPEMRRAVRERGLPLYQDQKRASVQIPGVLEGAPGSAILSDRNVILRLSNAADKTSFLHESAHIFLELYGALESQNEVVAERMAAIRKWLKLEEGASLTVQQHELFAEAFEAYLMEGKSPNAELRGVFQKFRAWFTEVYRRLRGNLPKLDQEARDIFDRMLATEDEIEAARSEYNLQLSSKMSGIMTPEQVAKYKDYAEKAGQVAQDKLFRKFMDQVQKRTRAEYKADKARVEALVRKELENLGVYRALNDLSDDGKTLREGVDPDIIAPDYGYATGDELLAAIRKAPKFENAVKAETKRRMDELHGDMLTDGTAEAEAIAVVFNEPSIKAMEAERDALAEKAARDPIPLKAIRARAEQMINSVPIDEIIKPGKYAIKARDLHKRAIRAAAKEQWDDALRYTHQAMLQHELARRAYKAREEIGKINRYLARYAPSRKLDPKKIDPRYIAQIRNLTGLPGADNQQDTMQKLRDFADREANEGNPVSLPLDVTMNRPMPIRRRMTMEQLRDFRDGVKALVYQGRANSAEEKARFNAEVENLAQVIRDNFTGKTKRETRNPTGMESMGSKVRELEALFLRYPFLVEALQGGKDGVVVEALEQGLRRQLTFRNERRRQMGAQLVAILDKHGITQDELNQRISAPAIESGLVKFEQVLAIALNMGTESNRARLATMAEIPAEKGGFAGTIQEVENAVDARLEERHWDAVQDIWNLINTLWPEAKAVEQRVTGGTPKKVDASPVVTKFGSYPGGYYPLVYDRGFLSNKDLEASDMKDLWKGAVNGMATSAATNKGFLKERQESASRPLKLSLDTIITHIDDVTNDIYMREETIKISRILRHTAFKEALAETHGSEYGKTLETVVKRVVHGTERAQDGIEKLFRTLRVNASVAILGGNIRTALLAPISYFQTVLPRYGAGVVLDGMASFYGNGFHAQNFITGKSAFMRERFDTLSREAHERIRNAKRQTLWNKAQGASYWLMSFVEIWSVSGPTWMGVYRDALAKGKSEADAITDADRAVATTQGSGLEIDQSILQGGNELQRSLTFMWGYVSGYYGVVRNDIAKEQGYRKTWPIVKHLVLLNIAASLMEAFLRMATGGDDEDPYLAAVQDMYWRNILGMLPGVSLAANRYGGAESPAISTGQDLFKSWRAWERVASDFAETGEVEGDVAYRAVRQTAKSAGIALGVPGTVQIDKMVNTLIVDDDPTPYELLFSGPDDDN
jgi:hypothetical protein